MKLTKFQLKQIIKEELQNLINKPNTISEVVFDTPRGNITVHVTTATTPEETAHGLMFRKNPLGNEQGMLFDLREEKTQSFYMKNTFIPLDIIFINESRQIVGIVDNAEPQTLTSRSVGVPSRYVLEVDGGWCKRNGIVVGQNAQF